MAWLRIFDISWSTALWSLLLGVALFVAGYAAAVFMVLRLPATYLLDPPSPPFWSSRHAALGWTILLGKNLLGVVVIVVGIFLALPGVPGPGLLVIAIGVMLLDFPGKHRLERKLISNPTVLRTINSLRKRFGKPPLISPSATAPRQEGGRDEG